jgi:hypothetical protein
MLWCATGLALPKEELSDRVVQRLRKNNLGKARGEVTGDKKA